LPRLLRSCRRADGGSQEGFSFPTLLRRFGLLCASRLTLATTGCSFLTAFKHIIPRSPSVLENDGNLRARPMLHISSESTIQPLGKVAGTEVSLIPELGA